MPQASDQMIFQVNEASSTKQLNKRKKAIASEGGNNEDSEKTNSLGKQGQTLLKAIKNEERDKVEKRNTN
jgi:hypothetical protein